MTLMDLLVPQIQMLLTSFSAEECGLSVAERVFVVQMVCLICGPNGAFFWCEGGGSAESESTFCASWFLALPILCLPLSLVFGDTLDCLGGKGLDKLPNVGVQGLVVGMTSVDASDMIFLASPLIYHVRGQKISPLQYSHEAAEGLTEKRPFEYLDVNLSLLTVSTSPT